MRKAKNHRINRLRAQLDVFLIGSALAFGAAVEASAQTPNLTQSGGVAILRGGAVRGVVSNPESTASEPIHIEPTLGGKISLDPSLVREISTLRPEQISYRNSAPLQKDDVASHLKIARWARNAKLDARAEAHFQRVVELDPENEEARKALRHEKLNGVWISRQERMERHGLVRVGGANLSRQEAELAAKAKAAKEETRYWKKEIAFLYKAALDGDVRARDALRRTRNPRALAPLGDALRKERDPEGRVLLVQAIASIGTPTAVSELGRVSLQDDDLDVRTAALEGIYRKKTTLPEAVEFFRQTLRTSDDVATINRAAYALGYFEAERAIPDLINALTTSHKRQITVGSDQTQASFNSSTGQLQSWSPGGGTKVKTVTELSNNEEVRAALARIVGAHYQTPVDYGFDVDAWIAWRRSVDQLGAFYPRRDH
ncbi:MAG: HEAT repeat domain-containing protein [Thermoguttaceae bacterium]|nr:HEAT repeat domain-containing protein [Thermoguttaceae bacterium]